MLSNILFFIFKKIKMRRKICTYENLWLSLIIHYVENYEGKESWLCDYHICEHPGRKCFLS